MPVIKESPNDLTTVFTVLSNALDIVHAVKYQPDLEDNTSHSNSGSGFISASN